MAATQRLVVAVWLVVLAGWGLGAGPARAEPTSLTPLGFLVPDSLQSLGTAVSADGKVVVGVSENGHLSEGFRWTAAGGMEGLGVFAWSVWGTTPHRVSTDGSVVIGIATSNGRSEPFRWTAAEGLTSLGTLSGQLPYWAGAFGMTPDGRVVVGASTCGNDETQAFRWTAAEGMVGLGYLPGGMHYSGAQRVSADGRTIVGVTQTDHWNAVAFRWTAEEGMVDLGGPIDSSTYQCALGISADGSVIVGYRVSTDGLEAFRWTAAEGMVGLGDLPGGYFTSEARGVSADGTVLVGYGSTDAGEEAMVWTAEAGMRRLWDVLAAGGVDPSEHWRVLQRAEDVSADGRYVVGWGVALDGRNEAFLAYLAPEPMSGAMLVVGGIGVVGRRRCRARASADGHEAGKRM